MSPARRGGHDSIGTYYFQFTHGTPLVRAGLGEIIAGIPGTEARRPGGDGPRVRVTESAWQPGRPGRNPDSNCRNPDPSAVPE
eukprot:768640-Hanusia_phi.AAC.11